LSNRRPSKGREVWGQLYTPVSLSKALFQLSDYDPRCANVSGLPVDNLWAGLGFGTLTYMYDMLLPNVSGWNAPKANVMQHISPTTPTELGPGYIIGQERASDHAGSHVCAGSGFHKAIRPVAEKHRSEAEFFPPRSWSNFPQPFPSVTPLYLIA
jgi:hypothetical protein